MRFFIMFFILGTAGTAHAGPTAEAFAQGWFTGLQLSFADAERQGKIPGEEASCLKALEYSQLTPVYESLLRGSLTSQEVAESDAFYSSDVGQKYNKHGILQIYTATGNIAPEAMPAFSEDDYADIAAFSQTGAGTRLIKEQVLNTPSALELVNGKIQEMVESCRQPSDP